MKISVVTVCRNSARTIGHTVESFLRQMHEDKELVIVDGVSTDNTLDIVRSFPQDRIRIVSEPDNGIYDAMNKGLRLYSGDAIGFLNSDDTFHNDSSLALVNAGLSDADIVFGDLNMVSDHTTKRAIRSWRSGPFSRLGFHLGWIAPHPTLYVKRTVVDTVGEFYSSYRISADYDFMLRAMMIHRFQSRYIPQYLVDFQIGGMSTKGWRATLLGNMECFDSRRRHFGWVPVDAALFGRPLRRIFQLRSPGRATARAPNGGLRGANRSNTATSNAP